MYTVLSVTTLLYCTCKSSTELFSSIPQPQKNFLEFSNIKRRGSVRSKTSHSKTFTKDTYMDNLGNGLRLGSNYVSRPVRVCSYGPVNRAGPLCRDRMNFLCISCMDFHPSGASARYTGNANKSSWRILKTNRRLRQAKRRHIYVYTVVSRYSPSTGSQMANMNFVPVTNSHVMLSSRLTGLAQETLCLHGKICPACVGSQLTQGGISPSRAGSFSYEHKLFFAMK